MSEARAAQLLAAEEFAALPEESRRQTALIRGEIVAMAPASWNHGEIALNVMFALKGWALEHGGRSATCDPGVVIERGPDTVLAPDGAFYAADRAGEPAKHGFSTAPPDLVLEVVSDRDGAGDVVAMAGQWLKAGVSVVWVVWPASERVTIYGPGNEMAVLGQGDSLTCESLLPGFALPLDQIFTA